MKTRSLLIAAAVLATAVLATVAVPAAAHYLDIAEFAPATSYTLYPDLRDLNGRTNNMGLTTDAQYGELTISDATGVVLTTPTTPGATVKGSPMAAGKKRGGVVLSATAGTIKVNRSGLYNVGFQCGAATGVNSAADQLDVFEQVGSASAAAVSPRIAALTTQIGTTANTVWTAGAQGAVEVTDGDASAGATFTWNAIASTGDFTCKQGRFWVRKIAELEPPTTRETY